MISQEYLTLLDKVRSFGYTELNKDGLIYMIKRKFPEFAEEYRLKELTAQGYEEDAIVLAWYGYNLIERLTGKSITRIITEAKKLHENKNAGYSGMNNDPWINFRFCDNFGIDPVDGVLTRLSDKYMRLINLWENPTLDKVGEKLEDTLMDFSAYLIIFVVLMKEKESK
jgi:hypothetical protein